jgi:hypothetical protein
MKNFSYDEFGDANVHIAGYVLSEKPIEYHYNHGVMKLMFMVRHRTRKVIDVSRTKLNDSDDTNYTYAFRDTMCSIYLFPKSPQLFATLPIYSAARNLKKNDIVVVDGIEHHYKAVNPTTGEEAQRVEVRADSILFPTMEAERIIGRDVSLDEIYEGHQTVHKAAADSDDKYMFD